MKKIIAFILCTILLTGTLSGCASKEAKAYANMMKLLESMESVTEGEIQLSFEGRSKSIQTISESEIMGISLSGLISYEKQQMQMAIDYLSSNGETAELTDVIIIGEEGYVNMSKMLEAVSPMMWADIGDLASYMSKFFTAVMDGNEYVYMEDPWVWETDDQLTQLLRGLKDALFSPMAKMDVVTITDNVYTMTIDGENLTDVLTNVLTEFRDNADTYAAMITGVLSSTGMSYLGGSLPDGSELAGEITNSIDDFLGELSGRDESGLKMIGTVSYDKESKTYTQNIDFTEDGQSFFKITGSVVDTEISEITAPEMYLTSEEFSKNIEDVSRSLYSPDSTENSRAFVYTTKESDTIQPFVNTDLSDYPNLKFYDYTAKSGTVYSVPIFASDDIKTYHDVLMAESPGMWQYFMSFTKDENTAYGDTAKSFIEWYVKDVYNYNYDNPSNSNMTVSPDESMAVMSFTYEDIEDGKITMIYVAMVADNGEEILLMNIDIYHDFMEDVDNTILSELSDLLGVNLSDFYSPELSTM